MAKSHSYNAMRSYCAYCPGVNGADEEDGDHDDNYNDGA